MSFEITTAMVKSYSANVFHLSQQKNSRLAGFVRRETQNGEEDFYDRIGAVTAQKKTGRHSDTTYQDTPHSRRRVTCEDYFFADLVDKEDKLRIIMSPESEYAKAGAMALGRAMDDVIIAGALGAAYTGKDGAVAVNLSNANRIAGFDGATTTGVGLTVKTLRAIKKKFGQNEVEGDLYMTVTAEQLDNMLGELEVTSSDYNSVKALVHGDVDSFMGFKFIRIERLPVTTATVTYDVANGSVGAGTGTAPIGSRRCFAWAREGILLATAQEVTSRMDELPGKHYATQIYAKMGIGAVRMEEVKVVEVFCKE